MALIAMQSAGIIFMFFTRIFCALEVAITKARLNRQKTSEEASHEANSFPTRGAARHSEGSR
jgi:hypothetical protein